MKLLEMIRKQGGINLFKQYLKNGTLFTAIFQFLLLGKDRTSLEILRLTTQVKNKQKLYKKFKKKLLEFDNNYCDKYEHKNNNTIWFCWLQGIEKAPFIVKKCYESLLNIEGKKIIVITKENINQYVQFPKHIIEKWNKEIITNTHITDMLRLELLVKYGGIWVDATVLCTNKTIPDYIEKSDLFFFQNLKPGRDGHCIYVSSWLISAKTHNKILEATLYLCYEYWKKYNYMMDYFLLHLFLSIVLDYYGDEWKKIIPISNATSHILLLRLFEQYDEMIWKEIKKQTSFHKLSYKFNNDAFNKANTYYKEIVENGDYDEE